MINLRDKILHDIRLIDFNKVFNVDIADFKGLKYEAKDNYKFSILGNYYKISRFFFSTVYKSIFTYPFISNPNKKKIFYIKNFTNNYIDFNSEIYEKISGTAVCKTYKRLKKTEISNFFYCIYIIFKIRKLWIKILKINGIGLFESNGIMIFLKFFGALSDVLKILPTLSKYKKLVSFMEMTQFENLVCQIANINKIKTFALEHGMGAYKPRGSYWEKYKITGIRSSVCKNILCWGKYSKRLFKNHTNAKIHIIGKARLPIIKNYSDGVTFIFQHKRWSTFNKKLFKIASSLKKYKIPISYWYKGENLINKNKSSRDGPLRKIIVGNSSNLLAELGVLNFHVYLLKNSFYFDFIKNDFIVATVEKIKMKYDESNDNYPTQYWKNFIECSGNESILRYKKIIFNNN